eukprot:TRINITY_DN28170_c0_g1_i1.p1 TRINITY_DN28170_c0_g1~~TRINITY_DN28170_c0_g1_i1.p1  ORF type:complete len:1096 (+),score=103.62 TRINITY_DN28170_c0_g1_i1:224-3511(+)
MDAKRGCPVTGRVLRDAAAAKRSYDAQKREIMRLGGEAQSGLQLPAFSRHPNDAADTGAQGAQHILDFRVLHAEPAKAKSALRDTSSDSEESRPRSMRLPKAVGRADGDISSVIGKSKSLLVSVEEQKEKRTRQAAEQDRRGTVAHKRLGEQWKPRKVPTPKSVRDSRSKVSSGEGQRKRTGKRARIAAAAHLRDTAGRSDDARAKASESSRSHVPVQWQPPNENCAGSKQLQQYVDVSRRRILRCKFGAGRAERTIAAAVAEAEAEASDSDSVPPSPFALQVPLQPSPALDLLDKPQVSLKRRVGRRVKTKPAYDPKTPRLPAQAQPPPSESEGMDSFSEDERKIQASIEAEWGVAGDAAKEKVFALTQLDAEDQAPPGTETGTETAVSTTRKGLPASDGTEDSKTSPYMGPLVSNPMCPQPAGPPSGFYSAAATVSPLDLSNLAEVIHQSEWQDRGCGSDTEHSVRQTGGQYSLTYRRIPVAPPPLPPPPASITVATGDRRRGQIAAQIRNWENGLRTRRREEVERCEQRRAMFFPQKFEMLGILSSPSREEGGVSGWHPAAVKLRKYIQELAVRRDTAERKEKRERFLHLLSSVVELQAEPHVADCRTVENNLRELFHHNQGSVLDQKMFFSLMDTLPTPRLLQDAVVSLFSTVRPLFGVSEWQWRQGLRERLRPLERGEPALVGAVLDNHLRLGPQVCRIVEREADLRRALADNGLEWVPGIDRLLGREVTVVDYTVTCAGVTIPGESEVLYVPHEACVKLTDEERRRRGPRAPIVPPRLRIRVLALRTSTSSRAPQFYAAIRCDSVAPKGARPGVVVLGGRDGVPSEEEHLVEQRTTVKRSTRPVWNEDFTWALSDEKEAMFEFLVFDVGEVVKDGHVSVSKPVGFGSLALRDHRVTKGVKSRVTVPLCKTTVARSGAPVYTDNDGGDELCVAIEPLNFGYEAPSVQRGGTASSKAKEKGTVSHDGEARSRSTIRPSQALTESQRLSRASSRLSTHQTARQAQTQLSPQPPSDARPSHARPPVHLPPRPGPQEVPKVLIRRGSAKKGPVALDPVSTQHLTVSHNTTRLIPSPRSSGDAPRSPPEAPQIVV